MPRVKLRMNQASGLERAWDIVQIRAGREEALLEGRSSMMLSC